MFAAALVPFALLVSGAIDGGLGANPVEAITHSTGEWTLRLLLVTLAITPLRRLTGWTWLVRLRRMIGLFAFFYLMLHFTTYVVLDASLDVAYIAEDVADRLYITAGFAAFLMLIPLALTSTNGWIRVLGKRWRVLHRLMYPAVILGVVHYLLQIKEISFQLWFYIIAGGVLLAYRLVAPALKRSARSR